MLKRVTSLCAAVGLAATLAACATAPGSESDLRRLEGECRERGGRLVPLPRASSADPVANNTCEFRGGAGVDAPAPLDAHAQARRLGRGVNILGYDPIWKDPSRARFQKEHLRIIRDGGFQTLRVNLHAFEHMDAQGALSPSWLKTLDWVVEEATAAGLNVILDEHDFMKCTENEPACLPKLKAFWTEMARRYADRPDTVAFELMNEPNGAVTDERWNQYVAELLPVVRRGNPTRPVIVGPGHWNSIEHLKTLRLPAEDRHLIVTVHYYLPFHFTHQGASWAGPEVQKLSGIRWGAGPDYDQLRAHFAQVAAWSRATDRPVFLGEFGAYDRAPQDSRIRYTDAVTRMAECFGFAWAYWQFDSDFVVYDVPGRRWNTPIHQALIPPEGAAASPVRCDG